MPKDSILRYETVLKTGQFILIVHGSFNEVSQAKAILSHTKLESIEHHQYLNLLCETNC
jgi:hypothetical protein